MGSSCAHTGKRVSLEGSFFVWFWKDDLKQKFHHKSEVGQQGRDKPYPYHDAIPAPNLWWNRKQRERKANNERDISCGDASDLLAQCAGVLSTEVLLPVCAGGD